MGNLILPRQWRRPSNAPCTTRLAPGSTPSMCGFFPSQPPRFKRLWTLPNLPQGKSLLERLSATCALATTRLRRPRLLERPQTPTRAVGLPNRPRRRPQPGNATWAFLRPLLAFLWPMWSLLPLQRVRKPPSELPSARPSTRPSTATGRLSRSSCGQNRSSCFRTSWLGKRRKQRTRLPRPSRTSASSSRRMTNLPRPGTWTWLKPLGPSCRRLGSESLTSHPPNTLRSSRRTTPRCTRQSSRLSWRLPQVPRTTRT